MTRPPCAWSRACTGPHPPRYARPGHEQASPSREGHAGWRLGAAPLRPFPPADTRSFRPEEVRRGLSARRKRIWTDGRGQPAGRPAARRPQRPRGLRRRVCATAERVAVCGSGREGWGYGMDHWRLGPLRGRTPAQVDSHRGQVDCTAPDDRKRRLEPPEVAPRASPTSLHRKRGAVESKLGKNKAEARQVSGRISPTRLMISPSRLANSTCDLAKST